MKILHVGLCATPGTNNGLQRALKALGEYREIHTSNANFILAILRCCESFKPDIVFMQIQTPGIIHASTISHIREHCGKIINFTGDVRSPLPDWYIEIGKLIDLTLFVSMTDVKIARERGINAEWIQIGFDETIFNDKVDCLPYPHNVASGEIIFSANNYTQFPLSKRRYDIAFALKNEFKERFQLYGNGWPKELKAIDTNASQEIQASILRGAKIAVSCSNFNHDQYISDRTLRIMGAGTFCLHHRFNECEILYTDKEHLVFFDDIPHMIELAKYYLEHEEERERIAHNGYELTHKLYTWDSFVKNIIRLCEK